MKHFIFSGLCISTMCLFITSAYATTDSVAAYQNFMCQQATSNPEVTPDLVAMACHDKSALLPSCEVQAKSLENDSSAVRFFIASDAPCTDRKSVQLFCNYAQSFGGYIDLKTDSFRDRAAKVCSTTTEAVRATLCGKADAAKQWQFAYEECPTEGMQIFMRECRKPGLGGEGGTYIPTEAECASRYKSKKW